METKATVDKLSSLAYGSIQWQDGEIVGYDIEMFETGAKTIIMLSETENTKLQELLTEERRIRVVHEKIMSDKAREYLDENKNLRDALEDFRLMLVFNAETFHKVNLFRSEKQVYDLLSQYAALKKQ